ncbi:glycosyltransferase [Modestobacter roseus]|uniref:GT2 family glycosyltransferase n=1 Tax=Modestobacter roseus TaxID=1181884 RepID=A0A562IWX9_9ACTN|nr:glycosyltransferase [Modestobacter roseus]MQA34016.1 glycosyltransferase [Modestobacter roseus]TWH75376.1 GT2 family glycosyltransferase [Modestobacter roseus]
MARAAENAPDLTVVTVAYRSRVLVAELLDGLPAELPVIVVDNSDGSDGLPDVVAARPNGKYLVGGGVGYARAANAGADAATTEVIVFVNPDTRPTAADLATLAADVAGDPRCAASAAVLVDPDGRPRLGVGGWEFSPLRAAAFAVGLHKVLPRVGPFARPAAGEQLDVDWVSGAVMAIRRSTFAELGGFDDRYYVYCEDVAFGRRARERGMYERMRSDVGVHGSSGGSGAPSLEMMRLRGASLTRYVRHHQPPLRAGAISAFMAFGYALRTVGQLALRNRRRAREHWAYAVGLVTARATVSGRVVTDR